MFKTIIIKDIERLKMLPKTRNFNPLVDLKLSCTCGQDGCDKRSTKQNEKHRSVPADHQKCLGVDIRITGQAMASKLTAYAAIHGFNAFGTNLKSGFIHLGYRPENNKIVTWEY